LKNIFIAFIILASGSIFAQKSDIGNWLIYFGNQSFDKRFNWHNEIQHRNYNAIGDLEQLLLRTGIGYNLTEKNNNILVGYGFIKSQPYQSITNEKLDINEHRLFQQYIYKHRISIFFIQHRLRVEQRFFENDFRTRYRYFLSLNIPLNKSTMEKNAMYLSVYNEVFINGNTNTPYDRNRLFGALGFQLSKSIKIEVGAMSQIFAKTSRTQFQIVLFNNIPFYREKS
jgi:hypothetical protein